VSGNFTVKAQVSPDPNPPLSFRALCEEDLPFGMELKRQAGWNQLPQDWQRFLALEPGGCFVGLLGPDTPAGTVTTTSYGARFGWIGMLLVSQEFRRRGIGTKLLLHAIQYLQGKGVGGVRMDATPLGKKLYDTLGFRDEYGLERRQGAGRGLPFERVSSMGRADLDDVCDFDAPLFGAPRRRMLELLQGQSPELCFVRRNDRGELAGYVMVRPGENACQIGPWVARTPEDAEQLLRAALTALDGQPVFLDVLPDQNEGEELVARYGFTTQRPFIRMYQGELRDPGQPSSVYAICGVETG